MTVIAGYAAVFNSPSVNMGFIETIDPGAFTKTLQTANVRGLLNHDPNELLGTTDSGTVKLTIDAVGLRYEITVNDHDPTGVSAAAKVARGDINGSSFSFQTIQDQWDWSATPPQRRLLEVGLVDVAPVVFPAYAATTATVTGRSARSQVTTRAGKVLSAKSKQHISEALKSLESDDIDGAKGSLQTLLMQAEGDDYYQPDDDDPDAPAVTGIADPDAPDPYDNQNSARTVTFAQAKRAVARRNQIVGHHEQMIRIKRLAEIQHQQSLLALELL